MPGTLDTASLQNLFLFDDITSEQLSWLGSRLYIKTFSAGSNVITLGQPGEAVYIVLRGAVKVCAEQVDGSNLILAILGPGETIGEMSLLDNDVSSATIVTLEETRLMSMGRDTFRECLYRLPNFSDNLIRILCSRLRQANEQLQSIAAMSIPARVARQLLVLVERYGRAIGDGSFIIPFRLTQSDLAGLVGASRVHVNKAMVYYKQRKYISVDEHWRIRVHNYEGLANRCPEISSVTLDRTAASVLPMSQDSCYIRNC